MASHKEEKLSSAELRHRAEDEVAKAPERVAEPAYHELARLVHELEVHQVELEMQNLELRRTQLALEEARDRYAALYDLAPVGYLTLDSRGLLLQANLTAASFLQVDRGQLIGRHLTAFMSQADADVFYIQTRELAAAGGTRSVEMGLRRADGSVLPALLDVAITRENGEPRFQAAIIDFTDKRRVEGELRDSLERFRQIAESIEDVFYVIDATTGQYLYLSPACEAVLGRPPERLYEDSSAWLAWIHPADRDRVRAALERAAMGGSFHEEYRVVHPDGSIRLVCERAFRLGEHGRVTGIVQDVTEERQLEQELRVAHRMEAIGTLASGIAHDFNNLLMGIAGCASMALEHLGPSSPAYRHVSHSLEITMKGASLTRQLLDFGDKRRSQLRPVDVDAAVAAAEDLLRRLLDDHIHITVETGAPGVWILANPGDIEQVLMNVATNARDAMSGGGELTIRTEVHDAVEGAAALGRHVVISVRDTGCGMDAATLAHAFEPFFTTKEIGKGTGFGLSTVFGVVNRLGGHITVDSAVGHGTTIVFHIPIHEPRVELEATPAMLIRGSETVLVVDDAPLVRMTVQSYLEALGYPCVIAADPAEAVRICEERAGRIDVLLTDVMMPGQLGQDLARELRARWPALRVLFMSAHPREELVKLGRLDPEAHLVGKPFDQYALGRALRQIIDGEGQEPGRAASMDLAGGDQSASGTAVTGAVACRVLVVDDNADTADIVREGLEARGYRAAAVYSGAEALEICGTTCFDVVLCDLSLGHQMSGYDVARALRADERFRGVYLVALTGFEAVRCRADATRAGFDVIMTKPVSISQIDELLRAH